ncbi:hypothetical protein [Robertkochia sediminum]|uniref:hypothetical protein n=1 Tax=Robertkochia sediminum TaxID=2785326 RepID=UPI001934121C|nr:hypothetical protein [Robertkochia sediminum]MBL7473476.1 hypothetical protein [Robertkochia sediminum]
MKTFIISALAVFSFGILSAQETTVTLEDVTVTSKNSKFIKAMQDDNTPQMALELQAKAANYDLIESEFYRGSTKSEYHIEFKCKRGSMYTTYNSKGEITRCMEKYTDVLLPESIIDKILEQYQGWDVKNSQYSSLYKKNKLNKKKYRILLTNGDQNKVIEIDLEDMLK